MDRNSKVIKTILEMFVQREYTDIEDTEGKITATKKNGSKICAFKTIIEKLNIGEIKNLISSMKEDDIMHSIVIYDGNTTPAVRTAVDVSPEIGMNIELFHSDDLQFNITKHILVPKHELLDEKEAKKFKKTYGTNIPIILKNDPVSRFYDFRRGDIIKITRKTGIIAYRIVR
jgi:DNA-directed RNA polymerase I, II, and III subunit RPABC1